MLNFVISSNEENQTLISFLKKRFKTTSLSLIYKLFRTKKIKADGENIRYYHYRLKAGEKIEIYDNYLKQSNLIIYPPSQSKIYFEIIYEDQNLLIALKEHGITMPSLDNAVRYYLSKKDPADYQQKIQQFFILTAVHRLDRLTKGLVIYPKNPSAKKVLYKAISDKSKITKKYLAVCEHNFSSNLPNYVSGYLWKITAEQKMVFSPKNQGEKAKHCAMEIKEISRKGAKLLLEITLHTGRKHQIRSILSYFGLPIVGDEKYNSKIIISNKIYLFAYQIIFSDLPRPLTYLNGKKFEMKGWEKEINNEIMSLNHLSQGVKSSKE